MAKIPNTTLIPSIRGVRQFTLNTYEFTGMLESKELDDLLGRLDQFSMHKQELIITTWQIDSIMIPGELRVEVGWQPA